MSVPAISNGTLPEQYQAARSAIAQCARLDECKSWTDKAAAIASYAKQADDQSLMKHAMRIRARAIKRCGELLGAIKADRGRVIGGGPLQSKRDKAARDAGLSKDQRKQAQRVAEYAKQDPKGFERALDGKHPATVTELAKRGTKKKKPPVVDLGGRDPEDFEKATALIGALGALRRFINERPPITAAIRGLSKKEVTAMRNDLDRCIQFFTDLKGKLK